MVSREFSQFVERMRENVCGPIPSGVEPGMWSLGRWPRNNVEVGLALQALPIGIVMLLAYFFRPDGRLLVFDLSVDEVIAEFTDRWNFAYGLRLGMKKYPELAA